MPKGISVIYANRNRDAKRIKASLNSLKQQIMGGFEVIFVDYGSEQSLVEEYHKLVSDYEFVRFFSLEVSQLLWNKSKALNYGITKAEGKYIFIADVDLIFHPESLSLFNKLVTSEKFFLFKLGYLNEKGSLKLSSEYKFEDLKPSRSGAVNGMILAEKEALLKVGGLDEFFHFYGAEDEDLFARLKNAGYIREKVDSEYFFHNWHQSFSGSEDKLLTGNPRIKNIMRINQRHFQRNRDKGIIRPAGQIKMADIISSERSTLLNNPTKSYRVKNILAHVEHFLREELPILEGEVIKVEFTEDPYYKSLKYKIKKLIYLQTQPYISMKEVNDMVLKEVLYNFRNENYSFQISSDLKRITFCLEL